MPSGSLIPLDDLLGRELLGAADSSSNRAPQVPVATELVAEAAQGASAGAGSLGQSQAVGAQHSRDRTSNPVDIDDLLGIVDVTGPAATIVGSSQAADGVTGIWSKPQQGSAATQGAVQQNAEVGVSSLQQQLQQQHSFQQVSDINAVQQGQHDSKQQDLAAHSNSSSGTSSNMLSLQSLLDSATPLEQNMKDHANEQGDANAKLRFLLKSISAKQAKTRQLLAAALQAAAIDPAMQHPLQQQAPYAIHPEQQQTEEMQRLRQQLADTQQQLSTATEQLIAAQEQLTDSKRAGAQLAEQLALKDSEFYELKGELSQLRLRDAESSEQLTLRDAELSDFRGSQSGYKAEIQALQDKLLEAQGELVALSGGHAGGRSWQQELQTALMEAEEDRMAQDAELKQLKQRLKQLQQQQPAEGQQQQKQQPEGTGHDQATVQGEQWLRQQQLEALQEAVAAAEAAAATDCSERNALISELGELKVHLAKLTADLQAAIAAKEEAQHALADAQSAAAAAAMAATQAAAEQVAAAEAELAGAHAAAASGMAEVAAVQQQLQELQPEQQQALQEAATKASSQPSSPTAAAAAQIAAVQGPVTPLQQQPTSPAKSEASTTAEGLDNRALSSKVQDKCAAAAEQEVAAKSHSLGFELLKASSENQTLREELGHTKDKLLLLLKLVKSAATQQQEQQHLPRELAALLDSDAAAGGNSSDDNGDVACLMQLVSGLEARYSRPEQQQQLLMRGHEVQFLLENALQQVHLLKAAAGAGCTCPSEEEYKQLSAATAAGQAAGAAAGYDITAPMQQAECEASSACIAQYSAREVQQQQPDGFQQQQQQWQWQSGEESMGGASQADAGQDYNILGLNNGTDSAYGSCRGDIMNGSGVYGAAAGTTFDIVDEDLGYNGLESAWWNRSSVEPVTDLPDFLVKKN